MTDRSDKSSSTFKSVPTQGGVEDRIETQRPDGPIDSVGQTALLVAAMRAVEHERPDGLFKDPFARALAGDDGMRALEAAKASSLHEVPIIEVRTHHFDEQLSNVIASGMNQVVILAAGMDSRAYRLPWPAETRVYEVDNAPMLARKAATMEALGVKPTCWRRPVSIDLRKDWPTALADAGFDSGFPTAWLVEGLLLYLTADQVSILFGRLDALSAPGSRAFFDCLGQSFLDSPMTAPVRDAMVKRGSPWLFGMDEPELILDCHGWKSIAVEPGVVGHKVNRWPFPVPPRDTPGVPHSFFVESTKQ